MKNINNSQNISISGSSDIQIGNINHDVRNLAEESNHKVPEKDISNQSINESVLTKLFNVLIEKFNISELKTLCFALNIDYELLPHETRADFVRELVNYCQRHDRIIALKEEIIKRSDIYQI